MLTTTKSGVTTTYTYDASGNRIREVTGVKTKDYVYDNNNRLTQITEKTSSVVTKVITYTYDNNGNQLQEIINGVVTTTNVYNYNNELISTTENNETVTYDYNVEGKRISKSNGADVVKFVYEGKNIILELDSSNNQLAVNVYGQALIKRETNDNSGYYLYNGHGDVVSIIDSDNQVLSTYGYDAFGVLDYQTGDFDNPYRYSGYYYDEETDNYYLMARYYNPSIARFITEDTYRGEYNDPLSLNRYVYVNNNPLIYWDPSGHFWEPLEWISKRAAGLVQGTAEFAWDTVKGAADLGWTAGQYIGSGTRLILNVGLYEMGLIDEEKMYSNYDKYIEIFDNSKEKLSNMPGNAWNGIKTNFATTFNWDNFTNYLTTNDYNEIKDYSKAVVQTGVTIYGGVKAGQGIYNGVKSFVSPTPTNPLSGVKNLNVNYGNMSKLSGSNYTLNTVSPYNGLAVEFGNSNFQNIIDSKIESQMGKRGWTKENIYKTIKEPYTTRNATNKATNNSSTAYYNKDGSYVVKDNITNKVIQISKVGDKNWIPDSTIIDPYKPNK